MSCSTAESAQSGSRFDHFGVEIWWFQDPGPHFGVQELKSGGFGIRNRIPDPFWAGFELKLGFRTPNQILIWISKSNFTKFDCLEHSSKVIYNC